MRRLCAATYLWDGHRVQSHPYRSREALVFSVATAVALIHALDDAFLHRGAGVGLGQHALGALISFLGAVGAIYLWPSCARGALRRSRSSSGRSRSSTACCTSSTSRPTARRRRHHRRGRGCGRRRARRTGDRDPVAAPRQGHRRSAPPLDVSRPRPPGRPDRLLLHGPPDQHRRSPRRTSSASRSALRRAPTTARSASRRPTASSSPAGTGRRRTARRSSSSTAAAATAPAPSPTPSCSSATATACSSTTPADAARARASRTPTAGAGTRTSPARSRSSRRARGRSRAARRARPLDRRRRARPGRRAAQGPQGRGRRRDGRRVARGLGALPGHHDVHAVPGGGVRGHQADLRRRGRPGARALGRSTSRRRVLLVSGDEEKAWGEKYDRDAGDGPLEHWHLPGVGHTAAIRQAAPEYERRVTAFFDAALGRSASTR